MAEYINDPKPRWAEIVISKPAITRYGKDVSIDIVIFGVATFLHREERRRRQQEAVAKAAKLVAQGPATGAEPDINSRPGGASKRTPH